MSAKGRKRKDAPPTEVADFEFYPTPSEAIISLVESPLVALPGGHWIDPCAGSGRIPSVINASRDDVKWTMVEIDERHRPVLRSTFRDCDSMLAFGDFVTMNWPYGKRADVLVMNPPFSHALAFVMAGFDRADIVVMLQRTNWLAPARASWLRRHMPNVYQLPKRPSFTGDGKTDAAEYSWFVWPTRETRRCGVVAMLDNPRQGRTRSPTGSVTAAPCEWSMRVFAASIPSTNRPRNTTQRPRHRYATS